MRKLKFYFIGLIIILAVGYVYYCNSRQLPDIQPTDVNLSFTQPGNLAWPSQGESAIGVAGTGVVDTYGTQTPKPTASTAKLITALTVLKIKPLQPGESGPIITLTQNDFNIYKDYLDEQGSITPVAAGEQISEYQMLEAMLLPSANNMADSLAIWVYGSLPNYSAAANKYVKSLGLSGTHIGTDASGFLPSTVSTAEDLVKVGELAMANPVLAGIVSQPTASVPVAGTIYNVNKLLGTNNIVGVKTGNTDQAGGVFVGAAKVTINGQSKIVVTANAGASTLADSLNESAALLKSAQTNFYTKTIVSEDTVVAKYKAPWAKTAVTATTNSDISATLWGGNTYKIQLSGLKPADYKSTNGQIVGVANDKNLGSSSSIVSLNGSIAKPSIWWRLSHP